MEVDSFQAATALLTEHLQFTPLSLIDDIIDMVNNLVYQGVNSLENGMFSTPPERLGFKQTTAAENEMGDAQHPDAKQEIEEGLHKLETLLETTVDKNFDKFEIYVLRNVLSVPPDLIHWIRLKHYENLPYPIPTKAPSPEAVQLLRRKVAASHTVSNALETEYARNEALLARLKSLTTPRQQNVLKDSGKQSLDFLTASPSAQVFGISGHHSEQPLTTNTTFTLSQLPALRAILADLRPKLNTLKTTNLGIDSAKDERREERREYIEQRTQTYLARNGRMMAEHVPVLPGKTVSLDAVEALEKVTNILGQNG